MSADLLRAQRNDLRRRTRGRLTDLKSNSGVASGFRSDDAARLSVSSRELVSGNG
jgi:hypothetical protein